jgi:hypothetical protein
MLEKFVGIDFEGVVMEYLQPLIPFFPTFLAAYLGYWAATTTENRKEIRVRRSIAVVLQAELIRLHSKINEHNTFLASYAERFSSGIDTAEALKYIYISVENELTVYRSRIKELSLFPTETAYSLVYCYGNIADFIQSQDRFQTELPDMSNSTRLGLEAKNLSAKEIALSQHIERIIPLLAAQSEAIPFTRK